jgi:hypothetical protein
VRGLFVAIALVLSACGAVQPAAQALATASPAPTALPSGVVDPQPLVARVRQLSAIRRADDITTKLVPSSDYAGPTVSFGPSASVPATVWVVAVVGDVAQSWGLLPVPNHRCGLYAFDAATGELWSTRGGALSNCQPYFARSLTPPDAPVRCAPSVYDNGVPDSYRFSDTRAGTVALTSLRDDSWRQPAIVGGSFLMQAPEGSVPYEDAFCLDAFVRQGPAVQTLLASGLGARTPATPPNDWAIWLRGYHAVGGSADATGHITVVIEPRAGYEWAFFDWRALVPGGGYVMFRFTDAAGRQVLPWRLANGP